MGGNSPLGMVQQDGCKPRLHELLARNTDDSSIYGYAVVEATQPSFPEACRLIRDIDCRDSDLVPLVLTHFSLSEAENRMLPKRVPWILAMPEIETQLQALRAALVAPLERQALPCVCFGEFVLVLANGGEARLVQASGATASTAFDHLLAKEEFPEWLSATRMAVTLNIRANPGFSVCDFDEIGRRLEPLVAEDSLVVMSVSIGDSTGIELTLLAVLLRQ